MFLLISNYILILHKSKNAIIDLISLNQNILIYLWLNMFLDFSDFPPMWLATGTKFGFLWNPNERYCFSRRRQTKRREKGSYQWCVKWFSLTKGIQSYPIVLCIYTKKRSMRWTMNMLSPIFPPNCPLSC